MNWIGVFRRTLLVVAWFTLYGCIPNAAVRRGDAAAARGDWREAEAFYRDAVDRDPDNVDLAKKYSEAKAHAVAMALRTSEACQASNDAACVDRELAYVLRLDPGNVQAARVRTQARAELARKALDEARLSLESDNPTGVWRQLETVRSYGVPAGQEQEMARLEQESAAKAHEAARALLERAKTQRTGEAVLTLARARELGSGAAQRNGQYAPTLAEIEDARRRAIAEEVAAQVKLGEEALAREDFDAAARAFDTAFRASGEVGLQSRASFASSMSAAYRAIEQRSFDTATTHLRAAIGTQEDRGSARALLEAVEPRVYRIRLESVAITPTKPGTNQPWVGKQWWRGTLPVAAAALATWVSTNPAVGKVAYDVTKAVTDVPPENRPSLVTFIELPDGRRLRTQKVRGIYVIYGAEFFLYTNKYDNRTVRLAVFHERTGADESVALANVPLGQIVSGNIDASSIQGNSYALQHVVFAVEPADAWQDGGFANVELQDQQENRASARSAPARSASRVQLMSASLAMPHEGGDGDGSNPDPYFEIHQGRRQIFKSVKMQETRSASWSFSSTDLYLDPNNDLTVKLVDADFTSDDAIATWTLSARGLLAGPVTLTTAGGTSLTLTTAARSDRPR